MQNKSFIYRLVCAIALIALSMNLGSPALPTQAQSPEPTAPAQAAAQPGAPQFQPLTGDSPLTPPFIDASPLLDQQAAMGNSIQMQRDQAKTTPVDAMGRPQPVDKTALVSEMMLTTQSVSQEGNAPAQYKSLVGMAAPRSLGSEEPVKFDPMTAMAATSPADAACYGWLYNPTLTNGTNWSVYAQNVYIDTTVFYTPPNSLRMIEGDSTDTVIGSSGNDVDAFGQVFYFPTLADGWDLNSLDLVFKTAEVNKSTNDKLFVAFYQANADGSLVKLLDAEPIDLKSTGEWWGHRLTISDGALIQAMKGNRIALIIQAQGDSIHYTDSSYNFNISVDDVGMRLCTTPEVPTGEMSGKVTQYPAADMSDALILLTYQATATASLQLINLTLPDSAGNYNFDTLYTLPAGGRYRVWFLNLFDDPSRVMLWAGPWTGTFANGDQLNVPTLDISNVAMAAPPNETEAVLKSGVTFQWTPRNQPGEGYYHCLYDEETRLDYNTVCTTGPITSGALTINESNFSGVPDFLVYGHHYLWYLMPTAATTGIGYSYYASGITLLSSEPVTYTGPAASGLAPSSTSPRDWLLMIYLAGDNNLGDPAEATTESSFINHFNTLQQIAPTLTNVHVVTLTDFMDNSGTQICYLSVTPAQCQQLGEQNTADPAVLASFINTAMANFPHNRRALMISDHGHGISGLAVDETTHRQTKATSIEGYMMSPDELNAALTNAGLNTAAKKLDLLYFNTCLMGNLETVYNVRDFANFMVASSNEMWMLNIYPSILPLFTTTVTDKDLAIQAANAYAEYAKAIASGFPISIAAYDLSQAAAAREAVSTLGTLLNQNMSALKNALKTIRIEVQLYDSSGDERIDQDDAFADLVHLALLIKNATTITNQPIKDQALVVYNALTALIIANQQVSGLTGMGDAHNLANAHGLSLYFPDRNAGTQLTLTRQIKQFLANFTTNNGWGSFTDSFIAGALGNPDAGPTTNAQSGPCTVRSGVIPPDGAWAKAYHLYISTVRR